MANQNTIPQATTKQEYQTLGKKVFWLFFLQLAPIAFVILLIAIILFILSFQPFLINTPIGNMQQYTLWISLIAFVIFMAATIIALALARLTYLNYTFLVADDSFKIKRGILNKTENAIPYRQIQNVDVERSLSFQMLGLSRLIILTAGHEDEKANGGDEAEGVIPAIDKNLAVWLQTELLKRADIQKTIAMDKNVQPANNNQPPVK